MFHYQESSTTRFFQVASAIVWCLFAAGPLFGFAALKPFLIKEHVYEDICFGTRQSPAMGEFYKTFLKKVTINTENAVAPKCPEQDLKLNLIFTVCAVLTNISALPIGFLLDNYGPKLCGLIGATFILLGTVTVINSGFFFAHFGGGSSWFDPYLTGYGLISLGGPFTFISSFHLSNSFPQYSGTILALLTGAFDASSSVFLIYSILNSIISSENYYFGISDFFKVYLLVPFFIFAVQLFLMPKESYQASKTSAGDSAVEDEEQAPRLFDVSAVQNELNEHSALLPNKRPLMTSRRSSLSSITRVPVTREDENRETVTSGGIFGILHGQTARLQFSSYWFILLALFTTIQMVRLNYFISTVNSQYTYLFGSHEEATRLNKIFDVALPLGGLVSIPFVGFYLDHFSTVTVAATLTGLSVLLGVLGFIPGVFFVGVVNVLLFVVYRPFFYTTISDISGKVFGFETFGIVYGSMMPISGIVNFSQSYFDKLTHTVFNMNPGPINYIFVSLTALVGGITVGYIKYESDHYGKEKINKLLQQEEDAAQ